jgi:hypothetical protein
MPTYTMIRMDSAFISMRQNVLKKVANNTDSLKSLSRHHLRKRGVIQGKFAEVGVPPFRNDNEPVRFA